VYRLLSSENIVLLIERSTSTVDDVDVQLVVGLSVSQSTAVGQSVGLNALAAATAVVYSVCLYATDGQVVVMLSWLTVRINRRRSPSVTRSSSLPSSRIFADVLSTAGNATKTG
jgi:hypothetical protein